MGEVIRLEDRRARRRPETPGEAVRAEFLFDLASPFTYLAAERVDRAFDEVTWTPACSRTLRCASMPADFGDVQEIVDHAEERAAALRLPLQWPERWPMAVPAAMRVAHYAAQQGRGGAFVLAATRLAFAGGFDLDDLEILTEAAAAAGLRLDGCLKAAREERRDGAMEAAARRLLGAGADRLPALWVDRGVFWGEDRVGDAAATARLHAAAAAALLGRDQAGENQRVKRLARPLQVSRAAVPQDRVLTVRLREQQLEVGVAEAEGGLVVHPSDANHTCAPCHWPGRRDPPPGGIDSAALMDDEATRLHGGRLIARRLKAHGVTRLFTLSGGHLFSLYEGCKDEGIDIVDTRHEATAAFAAEGWAKVTRQPGVAALTAGPGVTNGMSAMASAKQNHSPMIVLGGRAPAFRWGQGSLQEIDHVPFVRPIVKLAATAGATPEIPGLVDEAFAVAGRPYTGPVFLDFPLDVVFTEADAEEAPEVQAPRAEQAGRRRDRAGARAARRGGAAGGHGRHRPVLGARGGGAARAGRAARHPGVPERARARLPARRPRARVRAGAQDGAG